MFIKSSAHLLLWALAFFVFAVLAVLAVDVGLIDAILGTTTQQWLHKSVAFLRDHFGVNRANIELALKMIGLAISAVLGTLGFLRALHYADGNLPLRIAEFMQRGDTRHLETRTVLVAPYETHALKDLPVPKVEGGLWRGFARITGVDATQRTISRLHASLTSLDQELEVLSRRKQSCESQKSTVHLMRGLDLAAEAASTELDVAARRDKHAESLREFQIVLALNENDLDGLEQAARQARLLNSEEPALRHLEKMAHVAGAAGKPALQAKAVRFQAEILEERGTPTSLNNARALLETAIKSLEAVVDANAKREIELAALYERLGAVQTSREKYGRAERALAEAERRYQTLSDHDGLSRMKDLWDRLTKDKEDGEGPDDDGPDIGGGRAVA